jgi:hypothetical protein
VFAHKGALLRACFGNDFRVVSRATHFQSTLLGAFGKRDSKFRLKLATLVVRFLDPSVENGAESRQNFLMN